MVFFDIRKAYDTAWRRGVLQSLYDFGPLPIFIEHFLKNRKIKVRIGKELSDIYPTQEGIPQGIVLSCTCFMIAINDIMKYIPQTVKATLYVDDICIYASGSIPNLIERRLQMALNRIEKWCNKSGFSFSEDKTKCVHICRRRGCPKMAHQFSIQGWNIECKEKYKFLGIIIDQSLTWKEQIISKKLSCRKILDLIKYISHKKWGADRTTLLRLITMLLKPKLEYGVEAFWSASDTLLNSLDPIYNAAIRI